jgi:hypothetical protein
MHAGKRPKTLTGLIGIRLIPEEVQQVVEAATMRKLLDEANTHKYAMADKCRRGRKNEG